MARTLGCELVIAFGSRVTKSEHKDSDLDIAVLTKTTPDYDVFQKVYASLSDIFKGENVDVRFLNEADPLFAMQVVKNGVLLYGDQDTYDDLKMITNRRYVDDGKKYFPMHEQLLIEQQKRLRRLVHD